MSTILILSIIQYITIKDTLIKSDQTIFNDNKNCVVLNVIPSQPNKNKIYES